MLEMSPRTEGAVFQYPSEAPAVTGLKLWVEHGHGRRAITDRMQAIAPEMQLYGTPRLPFEGTADMAFPRPHEADATDEINEHVAKQNINAIWVQDSAKMDLSSVECTVHAAANPDVIQLVDDKVAFDTWLGTDVYRAGATEVVGSEAVAQEYAKRRSEGKEVCIKPVIGVGGRGYWRLSEAKGTQFLNDPASLTIHPELYLATLAMAEKNKEPQRLVMMDFLPGPEVSVDVLCWRGQPLIHAARTKADGVRESQLVESEHPMIDHARIIAARLAMHGIVSMQYRLDATGEWKMLEVNPRPAGGSIYSEDAGFGIISGWTKLVAGHNAPEDITQRNDKVTLGIRRVARAV